MSRVVAAIALAVAVTIATGCSDSGTDRADQNGSTAEAAGLPKEVVDFFELAAGSADAKYKVSVNTTDASGEPVQITTSRFPPDRRVDVVNADGTIDATIAIGGEFFQCTQASGQWECGELAGVPQSETDAGLLGDETVRQAATRLRRRADDYEFRIERRSIVDAEATCLITERKPGHEADPTLGASATLCLSDEGVPLLVEAPTGSMSAVEYSTEVSDDAFDLPAVPIVLPESSLPSPESSPSPPSGSAS